MNQPTLHPTAAQRSIYLDEVLHPDEVLHTMGDYLDVAGPLDIGHLLAAMRGLVAEADVLRARFVEDDGLLLQVVTGPDRPGWLTPDVVDLEAAGDRAEIIATQRMQADLQRRFDVAGGGALVRCTVFRLGPERHWVYLAMHHVLCDGFSRVPLYDRLAELYRAEIRQGAIGTPLPPLAVLVNAEDAYLASTARERDERYWAAVAADLPEPLSLSGRSPAAGRRHLRRTAVLPRDRAQALRCAASAAGVTWAVFAVAAVSAFAARRTGRTSSLVTLPVTARTTAQARRVPGMVANYLPVAADAGPRVRRDDLLRAVSGQVLAALRHQRFRGEEVRRMAGLDVADRRPFGPYVNVLPQQPLLDLGDARARLVNLATGIVDDLMVTFLDGVEGSLEVHLNGNPALYPEADLDEHLAQLLEFLASFAAAGDDEPLGRLRTGPGTLRGHGDGPRVAGPYRGVVERFLDQVALRGHAVAVKDSDGELSYAGLASHAAAVGALVGDAAVAAVVTRPGRWLVGGVLGTLGRGAAFVPLDPRAPAAHNARLLADSGAQVLLVDRRTRAAAEAAVAGLPDGTPRPRCVEVDPTQPAPVPYPPRSSPDDPAYVVFTSGTTGRPKGAVVRGRGLVNHLLAKVDLLDLSPADTVVQNAPATFDVSIWQMLAPLVVGGTVRAVTPEQAADPDALAAVVAQDRVTVLEVVPSLLGAALDLWDEQDHGRLSGLRYLMVTGETVPAGMCAAWLRRHPGIPVVNAYGPTECSDDVTHAVLRTPPDPGTSVPIGEPVRNTRLLVLGPDLREVARGSTGELYVAGDCLALGYVGDPAKSAGTFVADPTGARGARMYRTGDHVRWRADGQLEFVGRTDHQVKIRGQRVEIGGIEASLRDLPGVEDAVVLAADGQGRTALAAWVHGRGLATADLPALRDRLAGVLPRHMVPLRWSAVDSFPLTPHGKVDRAAVGALPCPVLAGTGPAAGPAGHLAGPGSQRSADTADARVDMLRAAFADVLRVHAVRADDDFFALGGDSIGAVGLSARVRAAGLPLTPRQVFEHRTPAALAGRLAGPLAGPLGEPAAASATPASREPSPGAEVEATPIVDQLAEDCPDLAGAVAHYAQVARLRSPVTLSRDTAVAALARLSDAHPMLRTRFGELAPGVWRADTQHPPALEEVTERLVVVGPGDDLADAVRAAAARLDPRAGRTWQALLEASTPSRLVLVVHHLCIDGVSWRILCEDLDRLMAATAADPAQGMARVPAEGTSFADWAAAQGRLARSADFVAEERAVWEPLTSRPARRLFGPLDPSRHTYGSAGQLRVELPAALTAAVLGLPPAYRADLNDVLLGALSVALHGWAPSVDRPAVPGGRLLVELEGHGREQLREDDDLDVSRTVGWFTTTFPVALDPPAGPVAAVKDVHQQLRGLPRHGLGHGLLRRLHPRGSRLVPDLPVPEVGFNYLGRFAGPSTGGWTFDVLPAADDGPGGSPGAPTLSVHGSLGTLTDPHMPLRHPVSLTATTEDRPDGPTLVAHWTWASELVADPAVSDLAHRWSDALALLVSRSHGPDAAAPTAADLPLVSVDGTELAQLRSPGRDPLLDVLPLTSVQRGMFLHSRFDDGRPDPYVLQVAADVDGPLDGRRLGDAFAVLFHDHPVLGAEIHLPAEGEPLLVVRRRDGLRVQSDDLGDLASADAEALALDLARADRETPFDLSTGPSVRCRVLGLGPGRHRVVLTLHHLLVDGWSMPLVVARLLEAYGDPAAPVGLPAVRSAYADYLHWVSRLDPAAARAAWGGYLDGLTGATLVAGTSAQRAAPTAGVTAAVTAAVGTAVTAGPQRVVCDDELTARLTSLAHRDGATVSTVVLVAWAAVLARVTGRPDVLFGLVVSTRPPELPGSDRAVGLLLNTVPVRVRATAADGVGPVLRRTQDEQLALAPFRHLGAAEILASSPRLRDHPDPFDTVVVVENFPFESLDGRQVAGLRFGSPTVADSRHHPMSLVVEPGPGRLSLRLDVAAGAVPAQLVAEVAAYLEDALRDLADDVLPRALTVEPPVGTAGPAGPPGTVVTAGPGAAAVAPVTARSATTPEESAVALAFVSVLRLGGEVDLDASFFALGGDSIAAIRLAGALRAKGLQVSPRDVFEARTAAAIAGRAATHAGRTADPADDPARDPAYGPADDPARDPAYGPGDSPGDDPFALTLDELDELDAELGFGGAPR